MRTITIRLDDETHRRLKRHVAGGYETLSAFVRRAIVNKLADSPFKEDAYEAWLRIAGDLEGSGDADLSTTYKARFKEKMRAKHGG